MFVFLPILLFFAVASAIPAGRQDIVYPTVDTLRSGEKRIKFRALDRDVELKLEPAGDIFSDDFALYEGEEAREIPSSVNTLKHKLYKDKKKQAAIYIEDDEFTSIEGIIGETMRIIPEETVRDGRRAHRVFEVRKRDEQNIRLRDELIPPGLKGGGLDQSETVIGRQSKVCIVVEFLIVTESQFSGSFSSNENYEKYLSLTVVYTQILIDTMYVKVKVVLIGFLKYTKASEPAFIETSAIAQNTKYLHCEHLIDNMSKYYATAKISVATRADSVMLVTLRQMGDWYNNRVDLGVMGIAWVAGVCDAKYKYGISEDEPNNFHEYINTVAHELIHNMGSPHDEENPVSYVSGSPGTKSCLWNYGYIMSYKTNAENGSKFSPCSSACVQHLSSLRITACIQEKC